MMLKQGSNDLIYSGVWLIIGLLTNEYTDLLGEFRGLLLVQLTVPIQEKLITLFVMVERARDFTASCIALGTIFKEFSVDRLARWLNISTLLQHIQRSNTQFSSPL